MIRYGTPWTKETVEKMLKLRREGYSARQIAKQLSPWITRNAVLGRLHRMRVRFRNSKAGESQTIADGLRQRSIDGRKPPKRFLRRAPTVHLESSPVPPTAVTFADLEEHHCKYPYGSGSSLKFCGAPATKKSYCDTHHKKCYHVEVTCD